MNGHVNTRILPRAFFVRRRVAARHAARELHAPLPPYEVQSLLGTMPGLHFGYKLGLGACSLRDFAIP